MLNKNLLPISIVIAAAIIGGVLVYTNQGCVPQEKLAGILNSQEIAQKAIDFINQNNMVGENQTASLGEVFDESGLYKFKVKIGENEFDSYVTKDGKLLFPQAGVDLEKEPIAKKENKPLEVPKTDTPDVKLFVMSYCPYGLQAQKGFLPVYNLLKDKAKMGVYFVDYIMHEKKEIDENLRQYCIQKEEKAKYFDYLSCFVKKGKSEECLTQAKIDKDKLTSCVSATDKQYQITEKYNDKSTWLNGNFPKFDVQADLNEKYGVGGSPTFVINDTVVEISRSSEKIKEAVCNAFNSPPEECSQILSEETPLAGFGEGTGASDSGGCE